MASMEESRKKLLAAGFEIVANTKSNNEAYKHVERYKKGKNNERWICKYCNKDFSGHVERMEAHLGGVTGYDVAICEGKKVPSDLRNSMRGALDEKEIKKGKNGSSSGLNSVGEVGSTSIADRPFSMGQALSGYSENFWEEDALWPDSPSWWEYSQLNAFGGGGNINAALPEHPSDIDSTAKTLESLPSQPPISQQMAGSGGVDPQGVEAGGLHGIPQSMPAWQGQQQINGAIENLGMSRESDGQKRRHFISEDANVDSTCKTPVGRSGAVDRQGVEAGGLDGITQPMPEMVGSFNSLLFEEIYIPKPIDPKYELNQWFQYFNPKEQEFITNKIRPILSLTRVKIEVNFIRALTHFWEPEAVAFRFGSYQLSPTLEEYTQLLGAPLLDEIYIPNLEKNPANIFSEFLGVHETEITKALNNSDGSFIKLTDLTRWFANEFSSHKQAIFCDDPKTWGKNRVNAYILAAFGTILFPSTNFHIHFRVAELVGQFLEGKSYMLALLAEQIKSLNSIKREGNGELKTNMALLIIWFVSHMKCFGLNLPQNEFPPKADLIDSLVDKIHLPEKASTYRWVKVLRKFQVADILWTTTWSNFNKVILACKDYQAVPLIGMKWCTGYCPNNMVKQFEGTQGIVHKPSLGITTLDFEDVHLQMMEKILMLRSIKDLWETRVVSPNIDLEEWIGEVDKHQVTKEYLYDQLYKPSTIQYQVPQVLQLAPMDPNPIMLTHMDQVKARIEVIYDQRDKWENLSWEFEQRAHTLKSQLCVTQKRLRELKEAVEPSQGKRRATTAGPSSQKRRTPVEH